MLLGVQEMVYVYGGRSHLGKTYNPSVRPISSRTMRQEMQNEFERLCEVYDPDQSFKPRFLTNDTTVNINYDTMAYRAFAFRFFVWFSFVFVVLMFIYCCCFSRNTNGNAGYKQIKI
jgi:hypothetical protein